MTSGGSSCPIGGSNRVIKASAACRSARLFDDLVTPGAMPPRTGAFRPPQSRGAPGSRTGPPVLSLIDSRSSAMTETVNLPVLPLADDVVLPGIVAPITLDGEAQAAVDAGRAAAGGNVVLVPRVSGAYNADGVVATIEQVGRLPSGEPAAVLRGLRRARIGAGVAGAGAALWVQVTVVEESP